MAGIDDLLGIGAPGGNVFNLLQGDGSAVPSQYTQQPQQPSYQPMQRPHGLRGILDSIGDALLMANGAQPIHQQHLMEQQQQQALSGFLTNPDQAIQQLMQIDPKSGIQLYSQVHPKSEIPEGVREYNYYNNLDASEKPAFEKFLQLTHPGMMAPYTMGPGDTLQMPGSAGTTDTLPTVATPEAAAKLPPGSRFRLPDGRIGTVPGGATASTPSATFPGR